MDYCFALRCSLKLLITGFILQSDRFASNAHKRLPWKCGRMSRATEKAYTWNEKPDLSGKIYVYCHLILFKCWFYCGSPNSVPSQFRHFQCKVINNHDRIGLCALSATTDDALLQMHVHGCFIQMHFLLEAWTCARYQGNPAAQYRPHFIYVCSLEKVAKWELFCFDRGGGDALPHYIFLISEHFFRIQCLAMRKWGEKSIIVIASSLGSSMSTIDNVEIWFEWVTIL